MSIAQSLVLKRTCKEGTWSNLCRTSLKSAHSSSRCLMIKVELHGMHSGRGPPLSKKVRVRRECPIGHLLTKDSINECMVRLWCV